VSAALFSGIGSIHSILFIYHIFIAYFNVLIGVAANPLLIYTDLYFVKDDSNKKTREKEETNVERNASATYEYMQIR
jgi:hypothetical protein